MSAVVDSVIREVRRAIAEHGMLDGTRELILAVSGGPDSVALFTIFLALKEEFGLSLTLAHFNHNLRGKESDADERFVQQLAQEKGVPYIFGRAEAGQLSSGRGLSLEDAARRLRYRFLDETFASLAADRIALGHTAEDQAETVMMRLLRGSGATGLRGILPVREGRYIRPLLNVWRYQIVEFLAQRGLAFRADQSNNDLRFLRNRIRHQLLPLLADQYNPRIKERLVTLANIITDEDRYLEQVIECELPNLVVGGKRDELIFPREPFLALDKAMRFRVLRWALQQVGGSLAGIGYRHMTQALAVVEGPRPGKRAVFPGGLVLERGYKRFTVKKGERSAPEGSRTYSYRLKFPGATRIAEAGITLVADIKKPKEIKLSLTSPMVACLDLARIGPSLRVRNVRPGDRFQPLGMKGRKKLQDLLVDAKVPRFQRRFVPVVAAGEEIVWVVGHQIADQFKVRPATKDILRLAAEA